MKTLENLTPTKMLFPCLMGVALTTAACGGDMNDLDDEPAFDTTTQGVMSDHPIHYHHRVDGVTWKACKKKLGVKWCTPEVSVNSGQIDISGTVSSVDVGLFLHGGTISSEANGNNLRYLGSDWHCGSFWSLGGVKVKPCFMINVLSETADSITYRVRAKTIFDARVAGIGFRDEVINHDETVTDPS